MRSDSIRMRLTIFIAVIIVVTGSVLLAQAPVLVGRFTAVTASVSGAGDPVRIEMLKWSTDADRDQFLNAWLHPPVAPPPAAAPAAAPGGGAPPAGGGRGGRGAAPPTGGGAVAPPAAGAAVAPPAAGVAAVPAAAGDAAVPPPAAGRGAPPAAGGRGGAGRGGAPPAAAGAPPLAGDAPAAAAGGRGGRGGAPAAPAATAPVVPETPESSLAAALQKANTVGILWTSESAGYSLKYAYRTKTPEGGERIIFATDRRLGGWSDQWWKPAGAAAPSNLPITVFELRFGPTGDGEGRTTLTAKIVEDATAKSIAVENYSAQPVVFKTVKKVK